MLLIASIAPASGCTSTADVHHASSGVGVALPTASAAATDGLSTGPTTASVASPRSRTSARPVPTSGGIRITGAGAILPDPARTPGAINPAVTQSDIGRTICVVGWTSTIRPPSSYTTALKQRELATGYAYRGDTNTSDYEEDHLISLELGGSPTAVQNLWPEPYAATDGARVKDAIENKLHRLVCAGRISLSTAQHSIARNWYASYLTYVGAPTPRATTRAPQPAPTHTTTVSGPPAGATALCNDGTYSYAAHHQGACSHHGGVEIFYN